MDATVETILLLWLNLPSGLLGYYIFRYQFFEVAIQRSLGLSLVGILLLVIYLFVVRGLRDFLEDRFLLPGLLVEAAMILALFALAQPLKRWMEGSVHQLFSLEMARLSGMAARLEEVSRSTVEIDRLVRFTENLLRSELGLQEAGLLLYPEASPVGEEEGKTGGGQDRRERFFLKQGEKTIGELQVASASGRLSTEQQAGVQLVAAQFVAALENCRLAQGKIELETGAGRAGQMGIPGPDGCSRGSQRQESAELDQDHRSAHAGRWRGQEEIPERSRPDKRRNRPLESQRGPVAEILPAVRGRPVQPGPGPGAGQDRADLPGRVGAPAGPVDSQPGFTAIAGAG